MLCMLLLYSFSGVFSIMYQQKYMHSFDVCCG